MSSSSFKDHFSAQSATYAAARPTYPDALFAWLRAQHPDATRVWDVGCGSGQAAVALATHFPRVIATDPSAAQIAQARPHPRVEYRVEPAEASSLEDRSADLVAIAQALHWFDLDRFYAEVQRVGRPGALCAAWTYGISEVDAAVDAVFRRLYDDILGGYWPPERVHVESGYRTLPFPFAALATSAPAFAIEVRWTLPHYLDYLRSWSASARYQAAHGKDPVALIAEPMAAAWDDPAQARAVRWPIALRVGRID